MRQNFTGFEDSLQDRRTANPGVRKTQPGLRHDIIFMQHPNRGQNRSSVAGTDRGTGAVGHHADGTGCGFSLRGVSMNGLRRRHP